MANSNFNSPYGRCLTSKGLATVLGIAEQALSRLLKLKIIPGPTYYRGKGKSSYWSLSEVDRAKRLYQQYIEEASARRHKKTEVERLTKPIHRNQESFYEFECRQRLIHSEYAPYGK